MENDFIFKNIKLHNALEYISDDSSVLIDTDKQYVIRVIKNEIDTEPTHILKCPKCVHSYTNVRNPIMPICCNYVSRLIDNNIDDTNSSEWTDSSSDVESQAVLDDDFDNI